MRGRLIFPFLAVFHRLDRAAMVEPVSDGHRHHPSALDPDFKEPVRLGLSDRGLGVPVRREQATIEVPCQIEPKRFEELEMRPAGASPRSSLELVMHFRDLERLGLVDEATGNATLLPGDRLGQILDREGKPVLTARDPPGLFISAAVPRGFGLGWGRPRRNLLFVRLEARQVAVRRRA